MENCTQVIDLSSIGFDISDLGRVKVGTLVINEESYDVYRGENLIGRDELNDIVLRNNSISSKHAVLEVEDWETHLLFDCGSTNRTRLGKILLKPNVRYNLQGDDEISFADIKAKYIKLPKPEENKLDDDSLSDAGSESLLNTAPVGDDLDSDLLQKDLPVLQAQDNQVEDTHDGSSIISDLNDSSLLEERQKAVTSKLQVIGDSDDSTTDDENDFIPPSQTVKEFASSRHAASKNKVVKDTSGDIFGSNTEVSEKNLNFNTQEQEMLFMTETPNCNKVNLLDTDSQRIFNSEVLHIQNPEKKIVDDYNIFEAETQDSSIGNESEKEDKLKSQSRTSRDIFEAETEIPYPPVSSDVEMSDLALSDALTELNTSVHNSKSCIADEPCQSKTAQNNLSSNNVRSSIVKDLVKCVKVERIASKDDSKMEEDNVYKVRKDNQNVQEMEEGCQLNNSNNSSDLIIKELSSNISKSLHDKTNIKIKEEVSDSFVEDFSDKKGNTTQLKDSSEIETTELSDMMTQVNVSLVEKREPSNSSPDFKNEDISDVCTQINTSLSLELTRNAIIKEEITLKHEPGDIAVEETQININLIEENKPNKKQRIKRASHPRCVEDISDIAAEETQPNLHLYSFFSESKSKTFNEDDIDELQTQPFHPQDKTVTEDSDCTDVEDNNCNEDNINDLQTQPFHQQDRATKDRHSTNVKHDSILKLKTLQDQNIARLQTKSSSNVKSLPALNDSIKINEESGDSNDSDSVLASVPLEEELLQPEEIQASTSNLSEEEKVIVEGRKMENDKPKENTCDNAPLNSELFEKGGFQSKISNLTEMKKGNEQNIENGVKPNQKTCDSVLKKGSQEVTLNDMDICSTVGDGTYVSACGSSRKAQNQSEIIRSQSQNPSKNNVQVTPLLAKQHKSSETKNMFSEQTNPSEMLSNSMIFNEPCGSSTPFQPGDRDKIVNKNTGKSEMNSPQRERKGPHKRIPDSPDLPCTEELLAVASATPETLKRSGQIMESMKQRDNLPLALKRTPRARKLSRKVAEILEEKGNIAKTSLSYHSLLIENVKEGLVANNDEEKRADSKKKAIKQNSSKNQNNAIPEGNNFIDVVCSTKEIVKQNSCYKGLPTNLEGIDPIQEQDVNKKKVSKRTSNGKKISAGTDGNETRDSTFQNKDILKQNYCTKELSVNVTKISKADSIQSDFEDHIPAKKLRNHQLEDYNVECPREQEKIITTQRSPDKKQVKQLNKIDAKGKKEKTPKKSGLRQTNKKRELLDKNLKANESDDEQNSTPNFHNIEQGKNSIAAGSPTKNRSFPSSISTNNNDVSNNPGENNLPPKKSRRDKISDQSLSKGVTEVKGKRSPGHEQFMDKSATMESKTPKLTESSGQTFERNYTNAPRGTSEEKNNKLKKLTVKKEHSVPLSNNSKLDNSKANSVRESVVLSKGPNEETGQRKCDSIAKEAKVERNTKKKLEPKAVKKTMKNTVKSPNLDSYDIINIDSNKGVFKDGDDRKMKKETKGKEIELSSHSFEKSDNMSEANIRRSNRRKKEDIVEIKLETRSLVDIKPSQKSKRKLKDDSVEKPEMSLRKVSRKDEKEQNKVDCEVSLNVAHVNLNTGNDHQEKSTRSRNSTRSRIKPARFRDKEEIMGSDSSSDRGPSKRQKGREVLLNVDCNNSSEPKVIETHNEFVAPSNSTLQDTKKYSEKFKTPVAEGRSRSKMIRSEKSRSPSSDSSRSSLKSNTSLPQSPRRSVVKGKRVLFTSGLINPTWESQVKKLGGSVVDCPLDCSLLVADKVRRTVKFLCVLGQGKPIVSPEWLLQSHRCTNFLEPMDHLLADKEAEEKFKFKLSKTIQAARNHPLLSGYHIYATNSVKPPPEDIKSIVESCGGEYLEKVPSRWPENTFIISHADDKTLWKRFKLKGSTPPIVAAEMLLIGVLQHKIEVQPHLIC